MSCITFSVLISFHYYSVFFIRTSNFGAEAEFSYICLRSDAENVRNSENVLKFT